MSTQELAAEFQPSGPGQGVTWTPPDAAMLNAELLNMDIPELDSSQMDGILESTLNADWVSFFSLTQSQASADADFADIV